MNLDNGLFVFLFMLVLHIGSDVISSRIVTPFSAT